MLLFNFFFTTIFIIYTIYISKKTNIFIDIPNSRSSHNILTPRIGGLPISISYYLTLALFSINIQFEILFASLFMLFIGIIDDYRAISNKLKLILIISIYFFLISYSVNDLLIILILVFALSLIPIGFNFIDGINGISSSLAIVTLIVFSFIYNSLGDPLLNNTLILLVTLIAFFFLNIKGKIFLGDSGTMFIGILLSYFSIDLYLKGFFDIFQMIFIHGIYIIDLITIIFYRVFIIKKSPFNSDRNHIHHVLYDNFGLKPTLLYLNIIHILILIMVLI